MAAQTEHAYEVPEPENWPLQLLAETGVLGLGCALFLLAAVLWPLRARARGWADDPAGAGMALALLCCAAACLACNLASLDLFEASTLLPLILLMALASALGAESLDAVTLRSGPQARWLVAGGMALLASVPPVQAQLHTQAARLLAQGQALSRSSRFADAVPAYELAVQFDPGLLEARYFLGNSLQDLGGDTALARAEGVYSGLRSYAPDYVQVHAQLGRLYESLGRHADAIEEYGRQLKLDPWDPDLVRVLTTLLVAQKRYAEAAALLEDAAGRWPGDGHYEANRRLILGWMQRGGGR
jgi:tetratricopeptide (TPR) repeat protein